MSEEKSILQRHIKELEDVRLENRRLEKLRDELISVAKAIMAPLSVEWEEISETSKKLQEEAEHPAFADMEWRLHAYSLIKSIKYYKQLKEDELARYADFIVKLAKELESLVQTTPENKPAEIGEAIHTKFKEIREKQPDLPLRFSDDSDRSVQGELNKIFGEESFGIIEDVISEEESTNGMGQRS